MGDDRRGLLWPLAVLFLLTACGAFIGFMWPLLGGATFDKQVACLLLIVALLSGGLLYVPRIWLAVQVPTRIDSICTALRGAQDNQDKFGEIKTAIDQLSKDITALSQQVINLNARFNPGGDVRVDIQAIRTLLATSLDGITTQLVSGDVRKLLDTINTQVKSLGDVNTKLDAIKAKLP
jgi:hypothetical protein